MLQYLVWFRTSDDKHLGDFRVQELIALAEMCGVTRNELLPNISCGAVQSSNVIEPRCPFLRVNLPNNQIARNITERSVLIFGILSLWAEADSIDEVIERVRVSSLLTEPSSTSYCIRIKAFNHKVSHTQSQLLSERLANLDLAKSGHADLTHADRNYRLMLYYKKTTSHLKTIPELLHVFFGVLVSQGETQPKLAHKLSLKTRSYIGPTSCDAYLGHIIANQAQAAPGKIVFDPFVGTGSLLIHAACFGAHTIGADIDPMILIGKPNGKGNIFTNFVAYGLPRPDILAFDNAMPALWRSACRFDAIICDPPYGVRAGARRVIRGRGKMISLPSEWHAGHIPRTEAYAINDVMNDLLCLAARLLRLGGRLVYLLPVDEFHTPDQHPTHPCLHIIADSVQRIKSLAGIGRRRRLITMLKVKESNHQSMLCATT